MKKAKLPTTPLDEGVARALGRLEDSVRTRGFSEAELFQLLVSVRSFASHRPLLHDLCHCLAHLEGRDKGQAQGHVKRYLERMTKVAEQGGTFGGPGLCDRSRLLRDLGGLLKECRRSSLAGLVKRDRQTLMEILPSLFDGIEIETGLEHVSDCRLMRSGDAVDFEFHINLDGAFIKIDNGAAIRARLIDP